MIYTKLDIKLRYLLNGIDSHAKASKSIKVYTKFTIFDALPLTPNC